MLIATSPIDNETQTLVGVGGYFCEFEKCEIGFGGCLLLTKVELKAPFLLHLARNQLTSAQQTHTITQILMANI